MAIKTLSKDEQAVRQTSVSDNVVTTVRTVKPDQDSPVRFVVNWKYDFRDTKPEEVLELASRALVIDTQRVFRTLKDSERENYGTRTFKVRDMIDAARTRKTADPLTKARNTSKQLSDEEKAELIAELQASMKK